MATFPAEIQIDHLPNMGQRHCWWTSLLDGTVRIVHQHYAIKIVFNIDVWVLVFNLLNFILYAIPFW